MQLKGSTWVLLLSYSHYKNKLDRDKIEFLKTKSKSGLLKF